MLPGFHGRHCCWAVEIIVQANVYRFEVIALHRRGKTVVGPYGDKNRAVRMEKIYPRIKPLLPAPIQ